MAGIWGEYDADNDGWIVDDLSGLNPLDTAESAKKDLDAALKAADDRLKQGLNELPDLVKNATIAGVTMSTVAVGAMALLIGGGLYLASEGKLTNNLARAAGSNPLKGLL